MDSAGPMDGSRSGGVRGSGYEASANGRQGTGGAGGRGDNGSNGTKSTNGGNGLGGGIFSARPLTLGKGVKFASDNLVKAGTPGDAPGDAGGYGDRGTWGCGTPERMRQAFEGRPGRAGHRGAGGAAHGPGLFVAK